jgi:hypothetical protein
MGDVFAWGHGAEGQLGMGNDHDLWAPARVPLLVGKSVRSVSAGLNHSSAFWDRYCSWSIAEVEILRTFSFEWLSPSGEPFNQRLRTHENFVDNIPSLKSQTQYSE